METEDAEKAKALARAARLEEKSLFVKAAEIYLSLGMEDKAASAYEKGGAFDKAASIFSKIGRGADAARCKAKRDAASTGQTWQDLQAEFQQDKGNPY
jgi:hypothetical protein